MSDKRREHKRVTCFEMIYSEIDDKEVPVGFLLNISESGAHVWLDSGKMEVPDFKILRLQLPEELNSGEVINIFVRNVWFADAEEQNFKKIGCQFIQLNENDLNIIKKLLDYFESTDSVGMF